MTVQLPTTPTAVLIEGGAGCGKTETLIEHVVKALDGGAAAGDILVFASTPDAAGALAARLAEADGRAKAVRVTTPRAYALDVLSTEEAIAATGRMPRLVQPFQQAFIMEDMKVTGLKVKRLREMLKFFYRSWTELADEEEEFLISEEEKMVHGLIKADLDFTRSILEPELAALTYRYLRDNDDALGVASVAHVFVDDYQQISRASQYLANILARESITVAADPFGSIEVFESYPYAEGIDEFKKAQDVQRIELDVCHRCAASTWVANKLRGELDEDARALIASDDRPAADSFTVIENGGTKNEFDHICSTVQEALDNGIPAHDIYVLTFNATWRKQLVKALRAVDIPTDTPLVSRISNGDYRDYDRCASSRLFTALALAADPDNALAWRCWCGYGDYLGNSAAFAELRSWCEAEGIGMVEALGRLGAMDDAAAFATIPGCTRIVAAYRQGVEVISAAGSKTGSDLLEALNRAIWAVIGDPDAPAAGKVPDAVTEIVSPTRTDASKNPGASELYDRAVEHMDAPRFTQDEGAVRVADGKHLPGLNPDMVLATGFVNGFIPSRDFFDATVTTIDKAAKVHIDDSRKMYTYLPKAMRKLVCSYFTAIDLEGAERLRISIKRIRLRDGIRVADTRPSDFLALIAPEEE